MFSTRRFRAMFALFPAPCSYPTSPHHHHHPSLRPPWVWRFTFLFVKLSTHPLAVLTCDLAPTERRDGERRRGNCMRSCTFLKWNIFSLLSSQNPPTLQGCLDVGGKIFLFLNDHKATALAPFGYFHFLQFLSKLLSFSSGFKIARRKTRWNSWSNKVSVAPGFWSICQ